jgi:hypothetical protein
MLKMPSVITAGRIIFRPNTDIIIQGWVGSKIMNIKMLCGDRRYVG